MSKDSLWTLKLTSKLLDYWPAFESVTDICSCRYDEPFASTSLLLRLVPSLTPIGTVRITPSKNKISRLCILAEYRKYGFGAELMTQAHKFAAGLAKAQGQHEIELGLHSQIPAKRFYSKYVPVNFLGCG
jgi:GNAT superfamily N-acetyltransferase